MSDMNGHAEHPPVATTVVKDPVCGMDVDPAVTEFHAEHAGASYFFCSGRCQATFDANPQAYVSGGGREHHEHGDGHAHHAPSVPTSAVSGEVAEWTCPMHPEIRRPGPGSCPICGMALEPVMVTAASGPSPELADMKRRFWTGVALSFPVVILGMGSDLIPAIHDLISARASAWAQLVLATPVVLWAGWPLCSARCLAVCGSTHIPHTGSLTRCPPAASVPDP